MGAHAALVPATFVILTAFLSSLTPTVALDAAEIPPHSEFAAVSEPFGGVAFVGDASTCLRGVACAAFQDSGVEDDHEAGAGVGATQPDAGSNNAAGRRPSTLPLGGWSQLWVTMDAAAPRGTATNDTITARWWAAGAVEGFITARRLAQALANLSPQFFPAAPHEPTPPLTAWLDAHEAWLAQQLHRAGDPPASEYWAVAAAISAQLDGLVAGYNQRAPSLGLPPLSRRQALLMNMDGDLTTLCDMFPQPGARVPRWSKELPDGHCSALVRVTEGNASLVFGHSTWDNYASMTRVLKHYKFLVPGGTNDPRVVDVSMSSTPGFLSSVDDFYVSRATGLAVTETTNHVFNTSLYSMVSPRGRVLSWMRAMVAMYTADSGEEWATTFGALNSGTYSCTWMICDLKRWQPGKPLSDGLFTLLEQLPGTIVWNDESERLRRQGFHAQYNRPFYSSIYEQSGWAGMAARFGDYYTYDRCPRGRIFARDATAVQSERDAERLLRYNNPGDPLQLGSAGYGIMARHDLQPGNTSAAGGCDTKVSSADLVKGGGATIARAALGPTTQSLPPWRWSTSAWASQPHEGQPDLFDFGFVNVTAQWPT